MLMKLCIGIIYGKMVRIYVVIVVLIFFCIGFIGNFFIVLNVYKL